MNTKTAAFSLLTLLALSACSNAPEVSKRAVVREDFSAQFPPIAANADVAAPATRAELDLDSAVAAENRRELAERGR
ncbi:MULTISPECIES: hypothetical protein [Xanthomonas]|uniref:hypothetical protein n=1 Tax=Xanthomonas TaxID=338 RepID=UPI001C45AB5D|nr:MULTISPECIES: hypothetical protein [Xanthomonas]MBV6855909.1 hypothetical protein [Xanthomonas campestris pv. mirabilis]MBV6867895.1 hypothetical protein [Xanthomonas campestris pv. coriandri]MCE4330815.1 hypothetical protein [Xanthomonas campestris pv. coriandri]MEA9776921.1 hypothetical protein [Xanthomonas campestris pv. raphani]